jgi:hypothetical protein
MSFSQSAAYQFGLEGELTFERMARALGLHTIAQYDYIDNGEPKGPRMHGRLENYVLPDFDVLGNGARLYAEVKRKSVPTWHRNSKQWQHGISYRHYQHYLKVEEISGTPVFLVVIEVGGPWPGSVMCRRLKDLPPHHTLPCFNGWDMEPTIYFSRDEFRHIDDLWKAVGAACERGPEWAAGVAINGQALLFAEPEGEA